MDVEAIVAAVPFVDALGIEVVEATDGHAEARMPLREEHSTNPGGTVAHGGVTYSLADTVGGAAVMSLSESVSPTVDMRIDYLAPATDDLVAEGDVVRSGGSVSVAHVEVSDVAGRNVATARGVYKTSGQSGESPWTAGVPVDAVDLSDLDPEEVSAGAVGERDGDASVDHTERQ